MTDSRDVTQANTTSDADPEIDPQKLAYITQAEQAWNTAWEILHDEKRWKHKQGQNLESGKVFSKTHDGFGVLHKMETYLECKPEIAAKMFITEDEESRAKWDEHAEKVECLEVITDNIDVEYAVMIPPLSIVSKREFVSIRHWKTKAGATLLVKQATKHPSKPANENIVRAEQKLAGMLLVPVDGNANKTLLKATISPKLGGWVPQFMIDKMISFGMQKGIKQMQKRTSYLQQLDDAAAESVTDQKREDAAPESASDEKKKEAAAESASDEKKKDGAAESASDEKKKDGAAESASDEKKKDGAPESASDEKKKDAAAESASDEKKKDGAAESASDEKKKDATAESANDEMKKDAGAESASDEMKKDATAESASDEKKKDGAAESASDEKKPRH